MSMLRKLFTAVKGGAREAGESIVDANAIRIFEQEIHEGKEAITAAKRNLTEVMAKEMQLTRHIKTLEDKIAQHEEFASQALDKGEEPLALEIAGKIAEFEEEKAAQSPTLSQYQQHIGSLKQQIKDAEKQLQENQRQLSIVKTTESVQQATLAVSDTLTAGDSSMASAKESLERIKQRQADRQDRLAAERELADEAQSLEQKMKAAGIGETNDSSADILARIKAKKNS
ncbi:PspA/IM30 family protein [Pseudoalteromonas sp. BZB3]|uniref:PspA/IM30 family protein n=1 Tax=Pseudoalteromonas sp. BZB3 TaxID=3136670 RepID=UPI0032C424D8